MTAFPQDAIARTVTNNKYAKKRVTIKKKKKNVRGEKANRSEREVFACSVFVVDKVDDETGGRGGESEKEH